MVHPFPVVHGCAANRIDPSHSRYVPLGSHRIGQLGTVELPHLPAILYKCLVLFQIFRDIFSIEVDVVHRQHSPARYIFSRQSFYISTKPTAHKRFAGARYRVPRCAISVLTPKVRHHDHWNLQHIYKRRRHVKAEQVVKTNTVYEIGTLGCTGGFGKLHSLAHLVVIFFCQLVVFYFARLTKFFYVLQHRRTFFIQHSRILHVGQLPRNIKRFLTKHANRIPLEAKNTAIYPCGK